MKTTWGHAPIRQCCTCGKMEFASFRKDVVVDGIEHDFCGKNCEDRYRNTKPQERRDFHYESFIRNGNTVAR